MTPTLLEKLLQHSNKQKSVRKCYSNILQQKQTHSNKIIESK